jgi:hypothetical protein
MKILTKINFALMVIIAVICFSACTVRYKTRHHEEGHEREGLMRPTISHDSLAVGFTQHIQEKKPFMSNDNKTK